MTPPAFDAAYARRLVAKCECPPSPYPNDPGLRAAFAVFHRDCFKTDEQAWSFYECKRTTYYEWKACVNELKSKLHEDASLHEIAASLLEDDSAEQMVDDSSDLTVHNLTVTGLLKAKNYEETGGALLRLYQKADPRQQIVAGNVVGLHAGSKVSLCTTGALSASTPHVAAPLRAAVAPGGPGLDACLLPQARQAHSSRPCLQLFIAAGVQVHRHREQRGGRRSAAACVKGRRGRHRRPDQSPRAIGTA